MGEVARDGGEGAAHGDSTALFQDRRGARGGRIPDLHEGDWRRSDQSGFPLVKRHPELPPLRHLELPPLRHVDGCWVRPR